MLKFARRNIGPPGGLYFYVVPETGMRIEYPDFAGLELKVREHMYTNDIRVPAGLAALIEDFMCRNLPDSFCIGMPDGEFKRVKTLNVWTVSDNTFRMIPGSGDKGFVKPDEAERRAMICLSCNNNLMGICSACSGLKLRFASQMRGLSTIQDRFLGVCAVDGSLLKVKVYAPLEVAERVMNKERTYEYEGIEENPECWVPKADQA